MALTPGTRLGVYEVTAQIGQGGMGQVYRAHDTKLNRDVALKILPDAFANDPDRLARFTREAQTLASLNHPNIAHIHGLEESGGVRALVMELVEGDDLSQRIARGAIPIDEALPIARQIAEALEAAHEQGIIHRDLKPANIKVRHDGTVKVLDFGLAKAMDPVGALSSNASMSPTITSPAMMTGIGMILGTAAYMSPEQARGRTVDRRADIWAFGVVLYEMLTGRRAFEDEDVSMTLSKVLQREPDFDALPPSVPTRVRQALHVCLRKDPKQRAGDIRDVRLALEGAFETPALPTASATSSAPSGRLALIAALGVAVVVIVALAIPAIRHLRETASAEPAPVRFQIPAPGSAPAEMFRLSPDGRLLAFVAPDSGANRLWVRSLDSLDAKVLPGTDGATYPFWSPDNERLGFFAQGKLKKIAVGGGPPQTLCDAANGRGGTWNREGEIVFSSGPVGPLYRVSATGGVPAPATRVAVAGSDEGHRFPEFLPDGRHFLYVIESPRPESRGLYVGALNNSEPVRILADVSNAAYTPSVSEGSGLLVFRREDTLMAQPFDPDGLRTSGEMFPVAEQVSDTGNTGSGAFTVATTGVLAFRAGNDTRDLVWIDRAGQRGVAITKPFRDAPVTTSSVVALSPTENRVAFAAALNGNQLDLWLLNLAQGGMSRLTFGPGDRSRPIWSPDGTRLVFGSTGSAGGNTLYQKLASGGDAKELLHVDGVTNVQPWDWSPDGKSIVYSVTAEKTASDLWLLPMEGDRKPILYLQTPASEVSGQFAPDGRWIAYRSNESGQNQIYVQPVPASGAKWQISTAGGVTPRWRHDGTELFYVNLDQTLMAVPVKIAGSFEAGTPLALPVTVPGGSTGSYAPSHDGRRFLVNVPAGGATAAAPPITVVLNWQAGLVKR